MKQPTGRTATDEQLQQLIDLRARDPHSVLGVHPDGDGTVLRVYRPDAVEVNVLPDGGGKLPMRHRAGGIFEARLNGKETVFPYLLEVKYPGDKTFTLRDPYAFLPTLGELDVHLHSQGQHRRAWEKLGAHVTHLNGVSGTAFSVWAPEAASVSVVGDFNGWDGRLHQLRAIGGSGIWELFVPEIGEGARYKYELRSRGGARLLKADPYAFRAEVPPLTASIVHDLHHYEWHDAAFLEKRNEGDPRKKPVSIYEVHLGSWRRKPEDGDRPLTYRELADELSSYCLEMGFTHVELLPVSEHPFGGSWGYQVGSFFSPTGRFGHPDDFRYFVDRLHERGIGVIIDWVPAHFPRDAHLLGRFDGTAVYEHADPRQGAHPDWGTYIFNYGRNEVRNFLVANALFWLREYHVDGLRVDAVASMLYLDYSRQAGQWIPNKWGGRENLEAIEFMHQLNAVVRDEFPGVLTIAEESTAWPKVSQDVKDGGLGFHFKWNMGWMHDVLEYFRQDPVYRRFHHNKLTFGMLYQYSENFVLPLSHDEVVHLKGSLLTKMPGDDWKKRAGLRSLFGWMWAHPGKKLLFMGGEFGQRGEWNHDRSLDWHLLETPEHAGIHAFVRDLNRLYATNLCLHEADQEDVGFQWIQANAADVNVYAFIRRAIDPSEPHFVCVANLSATVRQAYRVGFPNVGQYSEAINSDAREYGGSGIGNMGKVQTEAKAWDGQPASAELTLPPLSVVFFRWPGDPAAVKPKGKAAASKSALAPAPSVDVEGPKPVAAAKSAAAAAKAPAAKTKAKKAEPVVEAPKTEAAPPSAPKATKGLPKANKKK